MKNIMKNAARRTFVMCVMAVFPLARVNAGTVMGNGGATEVTQILNNLQLIQSAMQQAQMLKAQLKNMESFGNLEWGASQAHLLQLMEVVKQGEALSYASQNVEALFKQKYPGYEAQSEGFGKKFEEWSRTTLDTLRNSLAAAGMQSKLFATEEDAMRTIRSMAAGSPSAVQAVQAGVMVAAQQVEQLQKLRQLVMAQMQAQTAFMAKEQGQKDWEKTFSDQHFKQYKPKQGDVFASKGGKR